VTINPSRSHLAALEAESIHIMREAVAESERPAMLYSVGKDSSVLVHLAKKAFFPGPLPFPLVHVDTMWKFSEMYRFRDEFLAREGHTLIVHRNPDCVRDNIDPFTHGSSLHTDLWKTEGLKQVIDAHRFDVAFGGARRDEERSRAKERVFSVRTPQHRWDPKQQRPELWNLYNARTVVDGSVRVFPLSNWTELDVWLYIRHQRIDVVPLYLAAHRPIVYRQGMMLLVDDDRFPLDAGEQPEMRSVRFRTLGCYPLSGAIESTASTVEEIIAEMIVARSSERQGRAIDHDNSASMEKKKQAGYF
jgi:sulfate adenylyltransferase subunit 2